MENTPVLEKYVVGALGFTTARKETFHVPVEDGFLDLRFLRGEDNPEISAIEIRKL